MERQRFAPNFQTLCVKALVTQHWIEIDVAMILAELHFGLVLLRNRQGLSDSMYIVLTIYNIYSYPTLQLQPQQTGAIANCIPNNVDGWDCIWDSRYTMEKFLGRGASASVWEAMLNKKSGPSPIPTKWYGFIQIRDQDGVWRLYEILHVFRR